MRTFLLLIASASCWGADLKKDLTFRATFDGGTDATVARGDKRLYAAPSYKEQAGAQPGLAGTDFELAKGKGRKGDALLFKKKNTRAVFYKAEKNIDFDPANWNGTASFWLSLDPEQDLEPGFCDPIQITDKAYNDSAIWVDFTKDDKPRHFRLGVFGSLKAWNPQDVPPDKNPAFEKRLVRVTKTPFARGKWTHVAVTFTALGSPKGSAVLYLDGKPQGTTPAIPEAFSWDMSKGAIRLGVNYVGLLDDVAVFRRALTAAEIQQIASGQF
ncbi:MAG TPA: LamG domain-containing protein [Bryobacteraceae bacterium]|nr:LamG domain-containing protein [Bryobacteraceae bacterium]